MTVTGKWRTVAIPDYEVGYPNMTAPAYFLLGGQGSGEFAFVCVTGSIYGAADANAVEFSWNGNDEMGEANGDGWVELRPDHSLQSEIHFHRGDEPSFTAKPWATSSTACQSMFL